MPIVIDGECPELPNPINGIVTWTSLSPGGVATYTCNDGFRLVGISTRICGSGGIWSGMAPTCERKFITIYSTISYYHRLFLHLLTHTTCIIMW